MAESDVEVSTRVAVDLTEITPIWVLHVDDETGFLKAAKPCLEMQGAFQVDTALSVEEAEEKIRHKSYDVIVSDYVMPGKTGLDFLKELRESGNNIPFIIFTGRGREIVAIKALNFGADQYVNKIGDPDVVYSELAHGIRKLVKIKRAEEKARESEEKYRNLFENAKDVIVLMDLKGKITAINKAAVEYGFQKDEVIGKNMRKFVPEKYWPKLLKELVQIARGKTVEGKIEIITPKGKKDAEYRSDPMIVDNRVVGVQGVLRDITEHKKAEEALIRLSSAVKMTSDSVVISDIDGKIIDVNEATLKMYGTEDKENLIGKSSYDLIAPEDREKALAGMKETLGKGYVKRLEYNIITKDGGRVPVEMSVAIMKDVDGKPIGFVGISRGITERKRAEEALRDSEKNWSDSFNSLEDVMIIINKDYTIERINDNGLELLGKTREELIGKKCYQVILGVDAPSEFCPGKRALKTGKVESIDRYMKLFDKYFSIKSSPIFNERGETVGFVDLMRDITKRMKMEEKAKKTSEEWMKTARALKKVVEELKDSEERLKILFEFAPDAYYLNDLKGNFVDGNKAAEELTGYNKSELIGKSFLKLKLLPRSQIPKAAKLLVKNALSKPTGPDELTLNRKDGTQVSVEIRTFPVRIRDQTLVLGIARDISERKKAEEALRKSEKKLRFLLENIPDFVITVDRNYKILLINRGVPGVTVEQAIGTKVYNYVEPAHHEIMRKALEKVFRTGMLGKPEVLGMGPKGPDTVWYETRVSPNKIDDRVISVTLISSDISGRKKAEEALRESEEKWRSLVENAPNFIMVINLDSTIEYINRTVSGFTKEETIGKSIYDFIQKEYHNIARETINQVLKTGKPSKYETKVTIPQVGTYWYETLVGPLERDSKIIGATLISTDITERKKRERVVRESQEKFQRLFMNNPEAADFLDPTFHIIDVNPRFEELFGYSRAEIKGKHINDVVVPEDKMEEAKMLDKKAGERIVHYDTIRKRKDGSLVPVSISAAPIIVDGKLMGTVGLYKDISQLKKAEKALRGTMEELKMTNEKMRVVGRLTRHDVRNKLSAVTGNIFLTKQKVSGDREALTCLDDAESAVKQVERIFDFARTYEKLGVEELTYMNVEKSVREAVSLFSDLHGIKVINNCRGLTVLADSLLRQLFYNLIDNSLKYGEKVSKIRIHYKEVRKDQLKLVYEDDGVGLPKAEKEKIFKEGYGKGTGYGLYLIRKICEVYGWTIKETGKHGKGAQFTIAMQKTGESGKMNYQLS